MDRGYLLSWAAGADAGPGGLLDPEAVLAGALEALFLVLCAWELFPDRIGGRGLAPGAVLAAAGLAAALILAGFGPAHARAEGKAETPGISAGPQGSSGGADSWQGAARG